MPGAAPYYDVRAGFYAGDWIEVGSKYPSWALVAGAFRWEELAAGPIPFGDTEEVQIDRRIGTIFERLSVGQCRMQLANDRGQYTNTRSLANLVPYSENVSSGTYWITAAAATSLGVLVGKTGAIDAAAFAENNATATHSLYTPGSMQVSSGQAVVAIGEFFPGTRDRFNLSLRDATETHTFSANFSARSLTVAGLTFTGSAVALAASLQLQSDGWVKCWVIGGLPSSTARFRVDMVNSAGVSSYAGTGSAWIGVRAFQVHAGSIPGEFVPTVASLAVFPSDTSIAINDVLAIKALAGSFGGASSAFVVTSVYSLFSGYVQELNANPALIDLRKVQIGAVDVADRLRPIITTSLFENVTHRTLLQAVMSEAAIPVGQYVIETMNDFVPFGFLDQISAGEALNEVQQSGGQIYFVDGAGRLNMRSRHWDVASSAALDTFTEMFGLQEQRDTESILNRVEVRTKPRKMYPDVSTIAWLSDPVFIPAASSVQFLLDYYDPVFNEAGVPGKNIQNQVRGVDYIFNRAPDGLGADVSSNIVVTASLGATSAYFSVTNNGPGNGYLTTCQLKGNAVSRGPDLAKVVANSESIAKYQQRYAQLQSDLLNTETRVRNFAEFLIVTYAEPVAMYQATLLNEFPSVYTRDLLDRVVIQNSLLRVNSSFYVKALEHTITFESGPQHTLALTLEVARIKNWFTLDSPTLGRLDYNRLGF